MRPGAAAPSLPPPDGFDSDDDDGDRAVVFDGVSGNDSSYYRMTPDAEAADESENETYLRPEIYGASIEGKGEPDDAAPRAQPQAAADVDSEDDDWV